MEPVTHSLLFIELGAVALGLAILARIASRWGFSAIPLYLLVGLAFGKGGLAPLNVSSNFIHIGAEIGVLLLLFMLGLDYTGQELRENLGQGVPAGIVDFLLNFPPGLIAGFVMDWSTEASILLGGVTYISSSGVIAKVLGEIQSFSFSETRVVVAILVFEDLAMAIYLPIVAALLAGGTTAHLALLVSLALLTVTVVLVVAIRYGAWLSNLAAHSSDEILLLSVFGTVLLVAGIAQQMRVSAGVGAFLVGIAVSGPVAAQSYRLIAPLRDLFAATFFFFFGLEIDPRSLIPALSAAAILAAISAGTKVCTGYWAARRSGIDQRGRLRAGVALIARGEFSIVIAGLGAAIEPQLLPLSAAYVLLLAITGPSLVRLVR